MMETPREAQSPRKASHWPAGRKVAKDLAPEVSMGARLDPSPRQASMPAFDGVLNVDAVLRGPDLQVQL